MRGRPASSIDDNALLRPFTPAMTPPNNPSAILTPAREGKAGVKRPWKDASTDKGTQEPVEALRIWASREDSRAILELIRGSPVVVLLAFVPFAFLSEYLSWSDTAVFWCNFFALIPLAALLGDLIEEVAKHTNATIAGLLNASLGNFPEMVMAVQALRLGETRLAQASLLGSVLSNALLVAGSCVVAANYRRKETRHCSEKAMTYSSLLVLACMGIDVAVGAEKDNGHAKLLSRILALLLMASYGLLLLFQLRTHRERAEEDEEEVDPLTGGAKGVGNASRRTSISSSSTAARLAEEQDEEEGEQQQEVEEEEDDDSAKLSLTACVLGVAAVMALTTAMADYLVGSINGMTEDLNISPSFVGTVLLPIVGNVVEHISAITVSLKGKLDLALAISLGSAAQVATFVLPVSVVIGWGMGVDLDLDFPTMPTVILNTAVVLVTFTFVTGKTQWLKGGVLCAAYVMASTAFLAENAW